jgi:hypothetical protein
MKTIILLTLFVDLFIVTVVAGRRASTSQILPRSTQEYGFYTEPWCPSAQIDCQGFLTEQYKRIPGQWEEEQPVRGKHRSVVTSKKAHIRQVPGDGNCLFNAIVVSLNKVEQGRHYSFDGDNFEDLRQCAQTLREKAVTFLEKRPNRALYLQGDAFIKSQDLLDQFAEQYGITAQEYCDTMRQDGVWAGGPEIVALSNMLRRPIHLYELHVDDKKQFCLRRMCCFGSPKYDSQEAIHVLSADSRFPDIHPGRQLREGNHFLSVFPFKDALFSRKQRRVRGGGKD